MSFSTYEEYKKSGVDWIEYIPKHWSVKRLKNILKQKITDGPHLTPSFTSDGVPFLSVDGIQNGELVFESCRFISNLDHAEFRKKVLPQKNDLLMGKAASTGKIARVKVDFEFSIWSPLALIRVDESLSSTEFVEYSLKSLITQAEIDTFCTANTQKNISMDDIPRLTLFHPPLLEQKSIANFLDYETFKIDTLITEQEKLIEILKEKRQAVISHAVTKGLDPQAKMKDSGVEWLGRIPEDWKLNKFSRVFQIKAGGDLKEEFFSESSDDIHQYPIYTNSKKDNAVYGYTSKSLFEANTITVTGRGDIGFAVYRDHPYDAIIRLLVLSPRVNFPCKYYSYFINSVSNFDLGNTGRTAVSQLSAEQISPHLILEPPVEVQLAITNYLDQENQKISELIESSDKAIKLLQERRSALISAAVTGQIDVRNYQPKEVT